MPETVDGVEVYRSYQDFNRQAASAYAQVLTASTTLTPSTGKRIRVLKAQVLQNPDNATANLVTLSFASSIGAFVTGWVFSDSNEWTGDVNEALTITLAGSNPVSVNLRYKEY